MVYSLLLFSLATINLPESIMKQLMHVYFASLLTKVYTKFVMAKCL